MKPYLIVIDGPDGVGKTTVCKMLAGSLSSYQPEPVDVVRDPGSTVVGDKLRAILLSPGVKMQVATQFYGFMAARSELLADVAERLKAGHTVIIDRLWPSTVAYQVFGQRMPIDLIQSTNSWLLNKYIPAEQIINYVFLHAPLSIRRERLIGERGKDRFEAESDDFFRRVDSGYDFAARIVPGFSNHRSSERTIDVGDLRPDEVVKRIREDVLGHKWRGTHEV